MLQTGIRLSIMFVFLGLLVACGGDGGGSQALPSKGDSETQQGGDSESEGEGAGSSECETLNREACEVLLAVNQERAKQGLPALRASKKCQAEAQAHAQDMAQRNFFAHDSPTETTSQRFARFGLSGAAWGENIAAGYRTSADVMTGWMNSSGHRANILNGSFRAMGVGISQNSQGMKLWVQCFTSLSAG